MTDPIDQTAGDVTAPAATPSPEVAALRAEMDKRIGGLQTALNEAAEARRRAEQERDELKNAGLSDDEKAQLAVTKAEKRAADAEAKYELALLARDYGDDMPFYERMLSAKTAKEQLDVLRELRAPKAPPSDQSETVVPDVDRNRPAPAGNEGITLPDGTQMTEALADRLLRSVGRVREAR